MRRAKQKNVKFAKSAPEAAGANKADEEHRCHQRLLFFTVRFPQQFFRYEIGQCDGPKPLNARRQCDRTKARKCAKHAPNNNGKTNSRRNGNSAQSAPVLPTQLGRQGQA